MRYNLSISSVVGKEMHIYTSLFFSFRSAKDAFVAPVATGMGVALCLMALKRQRPGSKYIIWSRVDQKSCFKAILTAGLEPVIMSLVKHGDELRTDTHSLEDVVNQHGGPDAICAVVTATSVFAPRVADDVPAGKKPPAADSLAFMEIRPSWP